MPSSRIRAEGGDPLGRPASVFAEGAPLPPASVFDLGVPVLGICYGQQAMMHSSAARSNAAPPPSSAAPSSAPPRSRRLLEGWFEAGREQVWMSHGDRVTALPPASRLRHLARTRPSR
jgi:GMP synthase (glutamine-hydrolysing)